MKFYRLEKLWKPTFELFEEDFYQIMFILISNFSCPIVLNRNLNSLIIMEHILFSVWTNLEDIWENEMKYQEKRYILKFMIISQ
jgi:hypothetical protein